MTRATAAGPAEQVRPRNRSQRQIDESAELKASIVAAATEVFTERGYLQATLSEVAARVGLTRPGLLHHFGSKDALFRAVLDRQRDWANREAGDAARSLRELLPFVGGSDGARRPLQLMQVLEGESISGNAAAQQFVQQRFAAVRHEISIRLTAAQASGEVRTDADHDVALTLIAAAINGLQKLWLVDDTTTTVAAFELLLELLAGTTSTD